MAKIGTAHVELKPVLNDDALQQLGNQIERTVTEAVQRGLSNAGFTFEQAGAITVLRVGDAGDPKVVAEQIRHGMKRSRQA